MVIEDIGVDVIPREKVQRVRVEGCRKNWVRDCGSWGEKHRIAPVDTLPDTCTIHIPIYSIHQIG